MESSNNNTKPRVMKIPVRNSSIPKIKKVAAYVRVSKDTEQLLHSLSAQASYYSDLLQRTPGWEYAGTYIDSGITGTNIKARPEFQRMIADCEAGKIDLILTKSVSRFARNTVDLLSTVRHLKELGIEVRFDRENISSMSGDGEVMLSIIASFAEQESISLSNNILTAIYAMIPIAMLVATLTTICIICTPISVYCYLQRSSYPEPPIDPDTSP